MDMYRDETEFPDMDMIQKVVGMFESNPRMQRIVRYGLLGQEYEDEDTDYDGWVHEPHNSHGCQRLSDAMSMDRFRGNPTRSSHSVYQPPIHYYIPAPHPASLKVSQKSKESDAERNARLLEEVKQSEEKAKKKRLKKQKQKKRKQLEKEKQNAGKGEEGKSDVQQSDTEKSKAADEKSKDDKSPSVDELAPGKDTDSSEDESDGSDNDSFDSEDLDMTSTFVTKAALIAKRKLEQKPQHGNKEKKTTPVKESKIVPEKADEKPELEKKDSAAHSITTIEDNIRISTELAVIGNKFATSGDFNMAVKYFTNAIKFNPTEFKLFGNRSFCFEKMREYEKALADADLCLNMCPDWVKGLFRKGRALAGLKRYEEAAQAFNEVLRLEGSYAEAAQELMRVQIMQLMESGFTREQSSNALIIHGTVKKALAVLSTLNHPPGANYNALPPAQLVNVTGVSPVLSANTKPAAAAPPHPPQHKPLGPIQNMSNVQNHHRPTPNMAVRSSNENSRPPPELFPVWVGNLVYPVSESVLTSLFNKAGVVYSVKVLSFKRCAFVNFTKQEFCDEAIKKFHGFELNGMKIAVRYPDRIPHGMGMSRTALKSDNPQNESVWPHTLGGRRPACPQRCDNGDDDKN